MATFAFKTARGSVIELAFAAKWHTKYPAMWAMNFTALIKEDDRFEYLSTEYKYIGRNKIEYCKVKIINKHTYLHEKHANKICYLTLVTSNEETILEGDLEPQRSIRAVIIPEKVDFPEN